VAELERDLAARDAVIAKVGGTMEWLKRWVDGYHTHTTLGEPVVVDRAAWDAFRAIIDRAQPDTESDMDKLERVLLKHGIPRPASDGGEDEPDRP
jgi:hypothetical protein